MILKISIVFFYHYLMVQLMNMLKNYYQKLNHNLSSDFRISNQEDYDKYYKSNFDADIQSKFQYGFIENSIDIKKSSNISNPGCFALTAQLSLLPFQSLIKKVSITAITGSSGGGKNPSNKIIILHDLKIFFHIM